MTRLAARLVCLGYRLMRTLIGFVPDRVAARMTRENLILATAAVCAFFWATHIVAPWLPHAASSAANFVNAAIVGVVAFVFLQKWVHAQAEKRFRSRYTGDITFRDDDGVRRAYWNRPDGEFGIVDLPAGFDTTDPSHLFFLGERIFAQDEGGSGPLLIPDDEDGDA